MLRRASTLVTFAGLVLLACGDDSTPVTDAGAANDGSIASDAGADADGGSEVDGGAGGRDGGSEGCVPSCLDGEPVCVDADDQLCEDQTPRCTSFPGSLVFCDSVMQTACSVPPGATSTVACQ